MPPRRSDAARRAEAAVAQLRGRRLRFPGGRPEGIDEDPEPSAKDHDDPIPFSLAWNEWRKRQPVPPNDEKRTPLLGEQHAM
jgi:hypothetical protein